MAAFKFLQNIWSKFRQRLVFLFKNQHPKTSVKIKHPSQTDPTCTDQQFLVDKKNIEFTDISHLHNDNAQCLFNDINTTESNFMVADNLKQTDLNFDHIIDYLFILKSRNISSTENQKIQNTETSLKIRFQEIFAYLIHINRRRLNKQLTAERDFLLYLSHTPCEPISNQLHHASLIQIYSTLTKQPISDCLDQGCPGVIDWQLVGFQGQQPATDFRSTGILSLLCLLYMTDGKKFPEKLLHSIYQCSLDGEQKFPFCLIGINITGILLNCLLKNELNKAFNKTNCVVETFMRMFCLVFYIFYSIWIHERFCILDMHKMNEMLRWYCKYQLNDCMDKYLSIFNKYSEA
ncbi:unnamed protein product [Trichobilharzia szidati]|nr:unnamed protein product [Trichobilharzia szidati]